MPHRGAGHTTIEMADRRSPHRGHESPRAHRGAVEGAHSPSDPRSHHLAPPHGTHHQGNGHRAHDNNHLTPAHHGNGHGNSHGSPAAPRRVGRSPSPHADGSTVALAATNSSNSLNHNAETEKLPLLAGLTMAGAGEPLLERDATGPKPPLAGSEVDDLSEEEDIPNTAEAHPGVDDGFFGTTPEGNSSLEPDDDRDEKGEGTGAEFPLLGKEGGSDKSWTDDVDGHNGGLTPSLSPRFGEETPFPYAPEFGPGVQPRVIPDVNVYQQKKNLAQGMMDLALLSANANQLRYVLEAGDFHPYYYPSLVFICASLVLQIGVGVGLIVNSTYNVKEHDDICKADKINNFTVIGIFLITVVNVFIASFGVAQMPGSNGVSSRANTS